MKKMLLVIFLFFFISQVYGQEDKLSELVISKEDVLRSKVEDLEVEVKSLKSRIRQIELYYATKEIVQELYSELYEKLKKEGRE